MRSDEQMDIFRDSDAMMASVFRKAADAARHDPHWTPAEQQAREAHYLQEAARYERAG